MAQKPTLHEAVQQLETTMTLVRGHLDNPQEAKRHWAKLQEGLAQVRELVVTMPPEPINTPPNHHPEGEDPFKEYSNYERGQLILGRLSDDEVAYYVNVFGDSRFHSPPVEALLKGTAHMPSTYREAAKDRIRWLSRRVIALTDQLRERDQQAV